MTDENWSGQPVEVSPPSLETWIDDIIWTKVQYFIISKIVKIVYRYALYILQIFF